MSDSIERPIFIALGIIFVLLGLVLLMSILMSRIDPYKQITYANVQQLKAGINEVCFSGQKAEMTFQMPQNTPKLSSVLTFLPKYVIKTSGDPNYVIYYEAFPPGEGIGWESYSSFQNKAIVYITEPSENNINDKKLNLITSFADSKKTLDGIVVANTLLSSDFNAVTFEKDRDKVYLENLKAQSGAAFKMATTNEIEGPGKWNENVFSFKNYLGMSDFERTAIKYQSCGDGALCLKTRDGVYKFPLDQCNESGIDYIELHYDKRSIAAGSLLAAGAATAVVGTSIVLIKFGSVTMAVSKAVWSVGSNLVTLFPRESVLSGAAGTVITAGAFVKVAGWINDFFISYKKSDFYLASPCSVNKITITKTECECNNILKYPIYEYDKKQNSYKKIGEHTTCLDSVTFQSQVSGQGGDMYGAGASGNWEEQSVGTASGTIQCIRIDVTEEPEGFCWTMNAYNSKSSFEQWITDKGAEWFGVMPVTENTKYLQDGTFILSNAEQSRRVMKQLFGTDWEWPGSFKMWDMNYNEATICSNEDDPSCQLAEAGNGASL